MRRWIELARIVSAHRLFVDGSSLPRNQIQFLSQAFGASEIRRFPDDNGKIMHSEVRLDDSVLMIADCAPNWPAIPSHVHIYVDDVDAAYQRALNLGAKSIQEPIKKDDDDKRGGVQDAGGTTWWIATKTA